MCISATVIAGASLLTSAIGTVAAIDNANYNSKMQEYQLEEQREAMRQQQDRERLKAMEAEQARLQEYRQIREANLAWLGIAGTGQNMSFLQGSDKADEKNMRKDLRNIRIGMLDANSRLASQIRVNNIRSDVNRSNANSAKFNAVVGFAGDALSTFNYYETNRSAKPNTGEG